MRRLVVLVGLAGLLAAGLFAIAAPSSAPAAKGDRACPENPHGDTNRDPSCGKSGKETPCPENGNKPGCEEEPPPPPPPGGGDAFCEGADLVLLTQVSDGLPRLVCLYGPDNTANVEEECGGGTVLRDPTGNVPGAICLLPPEDEA